jgi:hypothetical protein
MGRVILGIISGVVIAVAVVFAIELILNVISPPPAGFDTSDPVDMRERVRGLPMFAFGLVLIGWLVGTALGSWAAVRIGQRPITWPGLVVGAVVFCSAIYNIMTIPHPIWFVVIAVLAIPVVSWLGASRARGPALPASPAVAP